MKFLHTADWQLGKPFARVEDPEKRVLLQQERLGAIDRIGQFARECGAAFVVVAGDLFDSITPTANTVSSACAAIGKIGLPVVAIPGNHDHGGPGGIWEQAFFKREQAALAPNLQVLLKPEPIEIAGAALFPCPLARRAETTDTTAWLRSGEVLRATSPDQPRILVAHGSTQTFASTSEDEDDAGFATNEIQLDRLPEHDYDYIALGDWHGTKRITDKAWYSGTPELDRFPKGDGNRPGNVLLVEVERGGPPKVEVKATARVLWREIAFDFADDVGLDQLKQTLGETFGADGKPAVLRLHLTGSLGIDAANELERELESLQARLLRLKLVNETVVAPTETEIRALTERVDDPLVSQVARKLLEQSELPGEAAETARIALRELHAAVLRGT